MIKRDALVKTRHSGLDPQLIEADTFKIIIPTGYKAAGQAAGQALDDENMEKLLSFCRTPRTTKEIMQFIELKHRDYFRSEILKPLVEQKKLFLLFPDKPTSPKQKYYSK